MSAVSCSRPSSIPASLRPLVAQRLGRLRFSEERFAAVDVVRRCDRAIELQRPACLLLAFLGAAALDQLLGRTQTHAGLPGRASALGPDVGGTYEVAVEIDKRELL